MDSWLEEGARVVRVRRGCNSSRSGEGMRVVGEREVVRWYRLPGGGLVGWCKTVGL